MDGGIHLSAITDPIASDRGNQARYLVQQRADLSRIIDRVIGHAGGDDLPGDHVHPDVQFPPGPPLPGSMFLDQPFAGPAQLQPRTVDQEVDRPAGDLAGRNTVLARRPMVE